MLAILLLIALLVIRTGPDSLLGKALRRPLVDWPAQKLAGLTRGRIMSLVLIALLISAGIALIGKETMQIMSMAMPETLAWLATFDLSVLVDALVAATLLATQAQLGRAGHRVRSLLARRPRPRARTPRRSRANRKAANDGEADRPATLVLLAA